MNTKQIQNNSLKAKNFDNCNLYVKGLWEGCTQIELDNLFQSYGFIVQSRVKGNGVGFVRYETSIQAFQAMVALNGSKPHPKCKKQLVIRPAVKKESSRVQSVLRIGNEELQMVSSENTKNVYIRGLPSNFGKQDLYNLCKEFGLISKLRLSENGFAFVRYLTSNGATLAIHNLHGKYLPNSCFRLIAKLANWDPFESKVQFRYSANVDKNQIPSHQMTNNLNLLGAGYGSLPYLNYVMPQAKQTIILCSPLSMMTV